MWRPVETFFCAPAIVKNTYFKDYQEGLLGKRLKEKGMDSLMVAQESAKQEKKHISSPSGK